MNLLIYKKIAMEFIYNVEYFMTPNLTWWCSFRSTLYRAGNNIYASEVENHIWHLLRIEYE